jgi:PAS domain S-box-containing protein
MSSADDHAALPEDPGAPPTSDPALTDQISPELKMAEGEARAWRLLQALPNPVIVADAHGIIELVNLQAVELFGYPAEQMVGHPVELLIPAGLRDRHRAHRSEYVASERPTAMTTGPGVVALRKDGTTVPVEVTLSAITLSTGLAVLASITDISKRLAADAELRISNERFRVSFDSAPIGMAMLDLRPGHAGTFLRVNQALCDLTGYPEAELLRSSSPAITHPDDRRDTIANLDRLSSGTATRWTTEKRYLSMAGDDVWVQFAVSVIHDVDGVPSYGVTQVEDITARKREEARIAERFHELATNVGVGFAVRQIDPPEFLYANPAFVTILGLDEIADGPPSTEAARSTAHPEDRELVDTIIGAAAEGRAVVQEWRVVRPGGEVRWVSERISPILDEHGRTPRVASVLEDITDRKSVELALRQSEQRFDQLARNIDVGIYLRSSTEMLYMNPSMSRIFGLDPTEPHPTVSETTSQIFPDDLSRSVELLDAAERDGSARVEMRIVRPDGEIRWISAARERVPIREDQDDRFAGTVTDITERKVAEDQATAARAEAERANSAKDEFLSRTSHELRTPLNAILGFASLLEADDLTVEQHEDVSQIRQSGEHLLALIDEVLDIDGAERGRLRLSMEPVQVLDVLGSAVAMLQPLAAQRRISVVVDTDGLDVHVHADVQRFKQVVVNLVANAVKYNRDGGEIRVAGRVIGDRLRLEVSDTGIGIAEKDLAHIFEPFERFAAELTQVEGSGLGLAVTKSLMDAMEGEVGVISRLGEGSMFWVELPTTRPAVFDAVIAPPNTRHRTATPGTDARTVLYVEDNVSNVRLLERVLANRPQVTLVVAMTGSLGIQLTVDQRPDLVLLDLHLPDLSGEEVLRTLRADPRTAATPVVVLSGDAMPGTAARLLANGATAFLTKPLDIARVLATVDDLTKVRQADLPRPTGAVELPSIRPSAPSVEEFAHTVYGELGVILTGCSVLTRGATPLITGELEVIRGAAQAVAGHVAGLLEDANDS